MQFLACAFRLDSSRSLKPYSNFLPIIRVLGRWGAELCKAISVAKRIRKNDGEADMARFEIGDCDQAALGESPAGADTFFELGMMYSIGRQVPIDYVSAHKWFNLAALRGNADAIRLRREIADQMSEVEVAAAQRAARAWLKAH
jgi:TPR repeat protein